VSFQAEGAPTSGTTTVRFVNAVSGQQIGSPLTRTGASAVALNTDGTKAVLADFTQTINGTDFALTTKVALYTVGGGQIGNTVTLPYAALLPAQFNADGTRAVLSVLGIDQSTPNEPYRTALVVIDGSSGAQVGSPVVLNGFPGNVSSTVSALNSAVLNAAGNRATLVAYSVTGSSTLVAVVDLTTGTQVGSTITLAGGQLDGVAQLIQPSADGSRLLVSSYHQTSGTYVTDAVVINTTTGTKQYEFSATGTQPVALQLTSDGGRLLVATTDGTDTTMSIRNALNGAQIGSTFTLAGLPAGPAEFSADGTRVVVAAEANGVARVMAINTVTGTQIGTTTVLPGSSPAGPATGARLSANGTYILAPTYTTTGGTSTTTATVLKIT
jgi:hypothetical protein